MTAAPTLMDKAMTSNRTNWLAWIVIPSRYRNTWCNRRGEHRPVNIDGQRKLCLNCGTW